MPRLAHGKPQMAGEWLALIGPFNGWLTAEKWLAWSGPFMAGSRQALNGSEMARLKGAIYAWLMASLKWQTNGYTEKGHLR